MVSRDGGSVSVIGLRGVAGSDPMLPLSCEESSHSTTKLGTLRSVITQCLLERRVGQLLGTSKNLSFFRDPYCKLLI